MSCVSWKRCVKTFTHTQDFDFDFMEPSSTARALAALEADSNLKVRVIVCACACVCCRFFACVSLCVRKRSFYPGNPVIMGSKIEARCASESYTTALNSKTEPSN
jgi:hypothetical protein